MRDNKEITLAEFLGWEEGKEYQCLGNTYRISNDAFQTVVFDGEMLRNAEKLRKLTKYEPLYYTKIKGWGLVKNSRFIYWKNEEK